MADFIGDDGDNTLTGGSGDDRIIGRGGDDTLTGGAGSDVFTYDTRGFGDDVVTDFNANGDRVDLSFLNVGDLGSLQPFLVQDGPDVVILLHWNSQAETIRLSNVSLADLSAADFVFDTSAAGQTVTGSLGDDILFGGIGEDIFAYAEREFGSDIIAGFDTNGDRIDLSAFNVADFDSLLPFIRQDGADVVIALDYHGVFPSIRLQNTSIGTLSAADFIFNTSPADLTVDGTGYRDILFGGSGNDAISGQDGDDVLVGGAGNDRLFGGFGADRLTGGSGNDVFAYSDITIGNPRGFGADTITDFDTNGDKIDLSALHIADFDTLRPFMRQDGADVVISFGWNSRPETIRLSNVSLASLSTADFIFDTSTAPLNLLGTSPGDDVLFGGNGDDKLNGHRGNDILVGGAGNDTFDDIGGNDTFIGGAGNDTFIYNPRSDGQRLFGNDVIADFSDGDRIDVSGLKIADLDTLKPVMVQNGADVVITLDYDGKTHSIRIQNITIDALSAADFIFDASTDPLTVTGTFRRDVLFGGKGDDTIDGGMGIDVLVGGAGSDTLIGGRDNDTLNGGAGNDIFLYGATGNAAHFFGDDVIADFNTAGDRIDLSALFVADFDSLRPFLAQDGTDVVITLDYGGEASSIRLKNTSIDTLSAADFIFNTSTADRTYSGTYSRDILFGGMGNDTINGQLGDDTLVGGSGADRLNGSNDNDVLIGGAGADQLTGGLGTDTASYQGSAIGVTVNLATGAGSGGDAQGDVLVTIENLSGSQGNDDLTGNAGANSLAGNGGDDVLRGGAGADRLDGGAGTDLASYFTSTLGVTVDLGAGTTSGGDAQGDVLIGIENLSGSQGDDALTGNAGANSLAGNGGNDVLRGGAGADRLDGGAGVDTASYFTGSAGVTVDLAAGTGSGGDAQGDTLIGIENVSGSQGSDTLIGNAGANTLQGWNGDDVLRGGAGADRLDGGNGTDTASWFTSSTGITVNLGAGTASGGDAQGDVLVAIENLSGSQGSDILTGNAGANVLQGWSGNDALRGGAGKDTLSGGAGADRFVYAAVGDSVVGANADRITDFSRAQGDKIDLSGIDANTSAAGNQAFSFIGSGLYTHQAGQLRYAIVGGQATIAGDVNGDGQSDFHIVLTGALSLQTADFVL
ncbi:MAG: M10 family metallopeptidase C-terminal domain-containing protein [Inquilinus limosus]|uniref:M10 family metallopeptidase C-terminal domain-containing protein n=1 Tax=Inquilinus limosus TaxID=171674 RepID=A0A952FME9_9PROT|nr:M10 family metallopeptidase C-terminal domain-containing protein [Inquilinus limosus]